MMICRKTNIVSKLAKLQCECDEIDSGRDRKEKSERKAICACERNIIEESCIFEAMETANYVRFPLIMWWMCATRR